MRIGQQRKFLCLAPVIQNFKDLTFGLLDSFLRKLHWVGICLQLLLQYFHLIIILKYAKQIMFTYTHMCADI